MEKDFISFDFFRVEEPRFLSIREFGRLPTAGTKKESEVKEKTITTPGIPVVDTVVPVAIGRPSLEDHTLVLSVLAEALDVQAATITALEARIDLLENALGSYM